MIGDVHHYYQHQSEQTYHSDCLECSYAYAVQNELHTYSRQTYLMGPIDNIDFVLKYMGKRMKERNSVNHLIPITNAQIQKSYHEVRLSCPIGSILCFSKWKEKKKNQIK